jgi:hypothetical protein
MVKLVVDITGATDSQIGSIIAKCNYFKLSCEIIREDAK